MVNRSNDKYVKKQSYFLRSEENSMIENFKLNKRSLNKLFQKSSKDLNRIQSYLESNNLSYKSEKDVIRLLGFVFGE